MPSKSDTHAGTDKPFLTQTKLDSFCRCPEAYRRRFIEGEVVPPGIAAAKGKGVHAAAEANFRQKIDTHVDLPVLEIIEAAAEGFKANVKIEGIAVTGDEESRGLKIIIGEALDCVVDMAEVHARQQAPVYQPVLVEETVEIELPGAGVNLRATLDLADDARRVVDFKTAGKRKNQAEADTSVQLTVYAAAYHARAGEPSSEQRLDTIVQTKTKTYRDVVATTRESADYSALAARINAVQKAIDAGAFPPATPGAWWCHPQYCGYFPTCRFVNGGRRPAQSD